MSNVLIQALIDNRERAWEFLKWPWFEAIKSALISSKKNFGTSQNASVELMS
jgi:hypothetical protein